MKIVMHEMSHCPNCAMVTRVLEGNFGDSIEIEHRVMDQDQTDAFIEMGMTSSPVVQVGDDFYQASVKPDRDALISTLEIMRDHESV